MTRVTLYIVRHAVALPRKEWDGPDGARPLVAEGERQVDVIVRWFAERNVDRLLTSPSHRCFATIEPIAHTHDVTIEKRRELQLDHESAAVEFARSLLDDAGDIVLCSHGEIIRPIMRGFRPATLSAPATSCAKGSIWIVTAGTRGITGTYLRNDDLLAASPEPT